MAKYRKSNKNTKKTKKTKKNYSRKNKKIYKGGQCGCRGNLENSPSKMTGGYGHSNLSSLQPTQYYDYSTNPNALTFPQSSRLISGGKKTTKKMRGGSILPNWLTNDFFGNNSVQFTGSTPGAFLGTNVINGSQNVSNSITNGPLLRPDSRHIA